MIVKAAKGSDTGLFHSYIPVFAGGSEETHEKPINESELWSKNQT
jgi:hypothetical protein